MARDILLISEARIATVQLLEQLLAHLAETTGLTMRSRTLGELSSDDFRADTYPLIVRSLAPEALRLTRSLQRRGTSYGFYLDDNFWLLDPETELGRLYTARPARRRLESIVRGASPVIASTPLLQEYLTRYSARVIQLDSFFDFSLVPSLPPAPPERAVVRGGFAASAHRGLDLEPVLSDVLEVLERHENLEFEVIGLGPGTVPQHRRIRQFAYRNSYADYVTFQRSRQWDFALAPLAGAASNLYKTDNKYREYAAQGIPGIYQDAPPYRAVRDGETGLIAGAQRPWREAIDAYVGDRALRTRVRERAREDAEARFGLDNVAPRWAEVFDAVPAIGGAGGRLEAIRRHVDREPIAVVRAHRRLTLLGAYGIRQVRERGVVSTAGRTMRFIAARLTSSSRVRRGGERDVD